MTVNLETMQVQCGDFTGTVSMGEGAKNMFVAGTWDACGQLVASSEQVRAIAKKLPYVNWSQVA
jgi:3-isopropylmalate/(R)-2-methylmalate dehydratase small subunit